MRILVTTDGSRPALHAVKYAVNLLRWPSSTSNSVTLVSVHDEVGLRHAKAIVGKVRTGHVAQEIVRCAKAGKFDLIALGAKGRGAIADLLLGAVAQRVLATAGLPVVLVK